ncbi:MAG: hypothetical protein HY238_11535 [Acidobacteria bacterium]|nr:hypothetical protein [Acidobacteriota bacterium]
MRGRLTDHRSDIFTFGAILYEMLSGRRAFQGESTVETMNAILKEDPPELTNANPGLERLVRHCLEKTPEARFQSARDLAFALDALSTPSAAPVSPVLALQRRRWRPFAATVTVLALLAAAFLIGGRTGNPSPPSFQRLTFRRGTIHSARFAPEGRTIVYGGAWEGQRVDLFSARPDSSESRSLGMPNSDILSISPSGEMAMLQNARVLQIVEVGTLAQAPLGGGAARAILQDVLLADWFPDGTTLAVIHRAGSRIRVEAPAGNVLYESPDIIGAFRISPKGDRMALAERPGFGANWSIVVLDRDGKNRKLLTSAFSGDNVSLAWSPSGDEIWFGTGMGGGTTLQAVNLAGRVRPLARAPVPMRILDVGRDGRALVARSQWRVGTLGLPLGETRERDLSWLDASETDDTSPDGKTLLLTEYGEGGGIDRWAVYLRKTDGSPAVRLGEGQAWALSPDGKRALAMIRSSPPQLVLWPTGPWESIKLPNDRIRDYSSAACLPDGKRILFIGAEAGRGYRGYLQSIDGGPPRPITQEGILGWISGKILSPDGKWFYAGSPELKATLYPIEGGEPRPIPGLEALDEPVGWTPDGHSLYVLRGQRPPVSVDLVDLDTGKRRAWKQLSPSDPAGISNIYVVYITADGKSYFYTYIRDLSDLYLVEGLR